MILKLSLIEAKRCEHTQRWASCARQRKHGRQKEVALYVTARSLTPHIVQTYCHNTYASGRSELE
eukprot:2640139-Pyramimonas_sp.AAC.1